MQLPTQFTEQMKNLLCGDEYDSFASALATQSSPTSIRLNPRKADIPPFEGATLVPWCPGGYYLPSRPSFTLDPLLHAGVYYVQEASSMYLSHIIRQAVQTPVLALDLCAAPGGKSTLLQATLPEGTILIANEIVHKRAQILSENLCKWTDGTDSHVTVTNNAPSDFRKLGDRVFDLILCDVPCSGEGMFRKDPRAIEEWSPDNVRMCRDRQRDIVADVWEQLRPGGYMIYSTCTYNTAENEENVLWIADTLGADIVDTHPQPAWNIAGSLLPGAMIPCCRFLPHRIAGEGFFCALLRKHGDSSQFCLADQKTLRKTLSKIADKLYIISPDNPIDPLLPTIDVDCTTALSYLHGEALVLPPGTPRGEVTITYLHHPLGRAKNIGPRANNLYPKQWRIRKQTLT